MMGGQLVCRPFERFIQKKFESRYPYLSALLQSCYPCQPSEVANFPGLRWKAQEGCALLPVPHPYYYGVYQWRGHILNASKAKGLLYCGESRTTRPMGSGIVVKWD